MRGSRTNPRRCASEDAMRRARRADETRGRDRARWMRSGGVRDRLARAR